MPSTYVPGTDNRNDDGYYTIPEGVPRPEGWVERPLPSVTTVLSIADDFINAERWWTALEFHELALASKGKQPWRIWHKTQKQMVEVHPGQVMLNLLPEHFGKNYGLHWMKMAGARELERRGNRGQIIHDAVSDFVLADLRIDASDLHDYTGSLIERRGYALKVEYCADRVWTVIQWLDRHLLEAIICESMVVNWTAGWAGTVDLICKLRGIEAIPESALWQIDFKTSKAPYAEHRVQAATYRHGESVILRKYTGEIAVQPYPQPDILANVYVNEEGVQVFRWGGKDDLFGTDLSIEDAYNAFLYMMAVHYYFARTKSNSPMRMPSLCMKRPDMAVLEAYRTAQGVNHEPTTIPAEGGEAANTGETTNGNKPTRKPRRKAAPKE